MLGDLATVLKPLIAMRLLVPSTRLTVNVDALPVEGQPEVAIKFTVLLDGKDLTPEQRGIVTQILRMLSPTVVPLESA